MELSRFIRGRLKMRHFNVLLALDDTLNVSRAAEHLNVTQASVSRTLAEVEGGFGLPLFERHPRGLRRTNPGREMILAVRQIVGSVLALEDLAGQFSALSLGDITIGLHNTSMLGRIASLVGAFKAEHPKVSVRLRDGLLPELLDDVRYGRLDMVFGRLSPSLETAGFCTVPLAETRSVIVARQEAPPPPSDPRALVEQPWVIPLPGTPMRYDFDGFCAEHTLALPANRVETNNPTLMIHLLQNENRYAMFPTTTEPDKPLMLGPLPLDWLRTFPFPDDTRRDLLGMIYSGTAAHPPAVAAFLARLRDDDFARARL